MSTLPDDRGRFGAYDDRFVPKTVIKTLDELAAG